MERLINRRQQGDLGEASAIEWFTRAGAIVSVPFGHSPDYDLVADVDGRLLRVQVKTSVCREWTPNGHERFKLHVATLGGNQSWNGMVKRLDPDRFDLLFAVIGDGRRWLIPAREIEGTTTLSLGGERYSEFEIEPGPPLLESVYGAQKDSLESVPARGSVGVWRAERVCKIRALALSEFESHLPHQPRPTSSEVLTIVPRGPRPKGQTRVSGHHQIVIPKRAFEAAELSVGDRLKAFPNGPGEVTFRRIAREENANGPP